MIRPTRRLAIGGRQHDLPMQPLDAPAILDEVHRQPVEQFRMRRQAPRATEIAQRLDDAATEVMMPDAIHEDARSKWMLWLSQPPRESQASSARLTLNVLCRCTGRCRDGLQNLGEAGLHEHAVGLDIASSMDMRDGRSADIPQRLDDTVRLLL